VSLWTVTHQALLSMEFYRQEYWSKLLSLLQGIFLTQGLNHGSPALQADSLPSEPSTLKHIYQQKYKNTNIILNVVELLRRKFIKKCIMVRSVISAVDLYGRKDFGRHRRG